MKLSMWMLANRLEPLMDIRVSISRDAKAVLNSARTAYATNCVAVRQEGKSVVCSDGEGNEITLFDMSRSEAFEIVQGVFDFYQDWEASVTASAMEGKFQKIIDDSRIVFGNPINIIDANFKVLGISHTEAEENMDDAWLYMCRYGYTSLNAMQNFSSGKLENIELSSSGIQYVHNNAGSLISYNCLSCALSFNHIDCGRITILEKDRNFNPGDYQILEKLEHILEPVLGSRNMKEGSGSRFNALYCLIDGQPYDENDLATQLKYRGWSEQDTYQLLLVSSRNDNTAAASGRMLAEILSPHLSGCAVFQKKPYLVVCANRLLGEDQQLLELFDSLSRYNSLQISFSLRQKGILNLPAAFSQAAFAMRTGIRRAPEASCYFFSAYAVDYMLDDHSPDEQVRACHPLVRDLWQMKQQKGDSGFETLRVYLDCERSVSRAAALLFSHRNTVLYRIRKIQEEGGVDLDDAYTRYYLRLSIMILDTFIPGKIVHPYSIASGIQSGPDAEQ